MFNSSGGTKFGRVTGEHVPAGDFRYKLAIVLDNVLQTAPVLHSKITQSGRITGNFTMQEVKQIVAIMNAAAARRLGTDAGPRHDGRGRGFQVTRFHRTLGIRGRVAHDHLQSAHVLPALISTFSGTLKPKGMASIAATTTCWISSAGCLYSLLHIGFDAARNTRCPRVPV